uniref:Uncharacterized protein n=1 Tax=Anopheles epiroticus TaxID=199890 RepID=A0A182PKM2_9DIPT
MVTCQKWWIVVLVSLQLLAVGTHAIPSPAGTSPKRMGEDAAPSPVQLDSDTGDDRELKSDDDGYDFLSIDQLFLNNPQYRQLISDLQAHTFGSNWRRKRDVAENELPEAFRSEASLSSPRAPTIPTTTATTATVAKSTVTTAGPSSTPTEALVTDVATNRDMSSSTSSADKPKAAALTSTPSKSKESTKEVTKPATSSTSGTTSTTTTTAATSTTVTSTSVRGSSTVGTSASYGSSGSTELPAVRNATLEMTTAAAPIRASTPRRLSHKNGSNKNKNKLSAAQTTANKPSTGATVVGPSTVNVNKVSVSSNAVASSSSSNQQLPQQSPPAVAIPATENGTVSGPPGNNKDKVSLLDEMAVLKALHSL